MTKLAWIVAACAACLSPAAAQRTWIVGPGGFAQIDPAIRAASPGDTILITATARYEHFTLDRGVTIRAATGVYAVVSNSFFGGQSNTNVNVPPGQTAELVRLAFVREIPLFNPFYIGRVAVRGGNAVFRDCTIEGDAHGCGRGWPALEVENASVALQICRLRGFDTGGHALLARNATVSAYDTTFDGGMGCWDAYTFGADAIRLETGSRFHASRIVIRGGDVPFLNGGYDAGHALVVDSVSRAWIAHAIIDGGNSSTGRGGDGIRNLGTVPVQLARVTATGGNGGTPGQPLRGPIVTNNALFEVTVTPVGPPLGATWTIRAVGPPRATIILLAAASLSPTSTQPLAQPLWLSLATPPAIVTAAVADPQGVATIPIRIPNTPGLRGIRVWMQVVGGTGGVPLQMTQLLGGQIW